MFRRGLSERFVEDLRIGCLAELLPAARAAELDVQIRDDYLNLYHHGQAALKLVGLKRGDYRAEIHHKYLFTVPLAGGRHAGEYVAFKADADFIRRYVMHLPSILTNIDPFCRPEATAEQRLALGSHAPDCPVVFIDRQVCQSGRADQIDLLGVTRDETPRVVVAEVKHGLNSDIQHLAAQLGRYQTWLTDDDGAATQEVAHVYRTVISQRQQLGLLSPEVRLPEDPVEVEGLIVLCDYKPKSVLWERAAAELAGARFPVHVITPGGPEYAILPRDMWERIA